MSRIIKFRVWDKEIGRMHVCGENSHDSMNFLDFEGIGENIACYNNFQNGEGSLPDDDGTYELMQYTGLKDKNGKEIYEGDIIACKFFPEYHDRINWDDVDIVGKVFWDLCGFSLEAQGLNKDRRYPELHDLNFKESEVIGNIYENPELLEATT